MSNFQHEVPPPQAPAAQRYNSPESLRRQLGDRRQVTVDVAEFVRTRDALTSAYMNLSQSIDNAVKAYLAHTETIIRGDGTLNASVLLEPFNQLGQLAQQALRAQGNGSIDPQLLQNGAEQDGEGDGKKKRKKRAYKQRDPNAPKRPLTAYFRYLGEKRPLIMEEIKQNPTKFEESGKPGDISKIATKRWNNLTQEQQAPYKDAYKEALKDYEKEVEEYKKAGGKDVDESKMEIDQTNVDPELDGGAGGGKQESSDSESSDDDSSSSESDDAEGESDDEAPAPPPQKKSAATPKSAPKKGAKQAQTFSSRPSPPVPAAAPEKASSPAKKRKAAAEEPEDTTKSSKKKSRKSTVTAGADPVQSPAPAPAAEESSPPATEKSKKSKKDKKKRKSSVEA